eukprot:8523691-Alexandrium_andersonii.AAC.1
MLGWREEVLRSRPRLRDDQTGYTPEHSMSDISAPGTDDTPGVGPDRGPQDHPPTPQPADRQPDPSGAQQ